MITFLSIDKKSQDLADNGYYKKNSIFFSLSYAIRLLVDITVVEPCLYL